MLKSKKIAALLCAAIMGVSMLSACNGGSSSSASTGSAAASNTGSGSSESGVDLSKSVNLVYYLWGSEGVANQDVLAKINEKLKADLNCTLEIKYIDWGDISTKYPLLFASGEKFDMAHGSPSATPSMYTLATQDRLTDITDMLDIVPTLRDEIPEKTWNGAKVNDRIYGVPCLYSEYTPYGYAYRDDLREKYNLEPITSLDTMEAYLKAVKENEDMYPINSNSSEAVNLYRLFVGLTGDWIEAPGIGSDSVYLVAESKDDYTNIISPVFTDEFVQWCEKMKEWGDAGYWPNDVLAAETGAKDNAMNGLSAGYITHMPDWTGNYGTAENNFPGVTWNWWSPVVDNGKIINKPGVDNSTLISSTSENPERALMVIEKLMTDESYYRLIQYGIEGRQYEIVDGKAQQPTSYDSTKDAAGFSVWSLRNDRLNIPYATEDPRRYELIDEWKTEAIDSPFAGFTFDTSDVTNEISAVQNVNASQGWQLIYGKAGDNVKTAVENYRSALENAGIQKIIDELKSQLADWTPIS